MHFKNKIMAMASVLLCQLCALPTASSSDYVGPIIDMHAHTGGNLPTGGVDFVNEMTGRSYKSPADPAEQKEETYKRFKKYNIVKAVVSGSNVVQWYKEDPKRIIPGAIIYGPDSPSIDELKSLHKEGNLKAMGEMGPYYIGMKADDSAMDPYFSLAEELQLPTGYHVFPGGASGSHYHGMPGIRASNASPLQLEKVLIKHPKLKIYMMHAGWPYLDDTKAMMFAHPQLYVGVGAINWMLPRKEFHGFLKALVDAGFGRRILFGSDQMEWSSAIDDAVESINSADFLSDSQKQDIFYNNAATFLGLSESEMKTHKGESKN